MTLALANPFRPTVRDWTRVVPAKDAATRLNMSVDTLVRRCKAEWANAGLAFYDHPADGGKAQWFVHRSADPKLQPNIIADRYTDADLSGFNEKQRNTAYARRHCVLQLAEWRRTRHDLTIGQAVAHVIAYSAERFPTLKISKSSLYKWDRLYKHPCDLAKLVDSRGGDRRSQGCAEAWALFRSMFLNDHQPAVREVWKLVRSAAAECDWTWCSLGSCRNQLDKRISPQDQTKYRQPAKYRSALAPYIEQPTDRFTAGECWVGDHKQIDLVCKWDGKLVRPWLTAWMDWRTRKIVGWVLTTSPNSHTILAAFRRGMLDASNRGGPEQVWIDNGKDYAEWIFHGTTKQERREKFSVNEAGAVGIFDMLKIKPHFSLAYNPNGKARLERFFGNLTSFARHFPTYCGRGVGDKPESLAAALKNPTKVPAFAEVESRVADFLAGYNANPEHDMTDMAEVGEQLAPAEAFDRWCRRQRSYDAAALDACLEVWTRDVVVGRNGIRISVRGQPVRYGQFDPMLSPYKAATKAKRSPLRVSYDSADMRTVKVWTSDMRFIAEVRMNGPGGTWNEPISADVLGELLSQQRSYTRSKAIVNREAYKQYLTNEERIAQIAAEKTKPLSAPAETLRIVPTPLDGQGDAVARGTLRKAVGAENVAADTLTSADWMNKLNDAATPRREPQHSSLIQWAEED